MIRVYVDQVEEDSLEATFKDEDAFNNNKNIILAALTGYPSIRDILVEDAGNGIYEVYKKDYSTSGQEDEDEDGGAMDSYEPLGYSFIVVQE